jgi:predicted nucleic acid-binding protein
LAIAKNRKIPTSTDDFDARKVTNILGVPVSGAVCCWLDALKRT